MLIDKSLKEYIFETSTANPTPGGGSVSALAASLGTALTQMVGNLSFDKKAFFQLDEDIKEELNDKFNILNEKENILSAIVDEDSKAFDGVMEAFKMPKDTDEEKQNRSRAIQEGYKHALEVPLRCAKECLEVLKLQGVFADYGNINAITDVGVGGLLVFSALEGALLNVRINLLSIKDEDYKEGINSEIGLIFKEGQDLKERILDTVYKRLGE